MTIQECYLQLGGNFNEVLGRFRKPEMVQRFAMKFPKDQSFAELVQYLEGGNVQEAFRAAHTLKGVCANLSFTRLFESASAITELLRAGKLEEAKAYFPEVEKAYQTTIAALHGME